MFLLSGKTCLIVAEAGRFSNFILLQFLKSMLTRFGLSCVVRKIGRINIVLTNRRFLENT